MVVPSLPSGQAAIESLETMERLLELLNYFLELGWRSFLAGVDVGSGTVEGRVESIPVAQKS